jgi:hypothetical protein
MAGPEGLGSILGQQPITIATNRGRWRSVRDCGNARALAAALTCGFLTLRHDSLILQCTGRIAGVGSDTEEDGASTPPAPTSSPLSSAFVGLLIRRWTGSVGEDVHRSGEHFVDGRLFSPFRSPRRRHRRPSQMGREDLLISDPPRTAVRSLSRPRSRSPRRSD